MLHFSGKSRGKKKPHFLTVKKWGLVCLPAGISVREDVRVQPNEMVPDSNTR